MIDRDTFKFTDDLDIRIVKHEYAPNGAIIINWSSNIGFGQYILQMEDDGTLIAYTECMDADYDKWFTKQLLNKLAEQIHIVE